jgi:hypothetical protein
MGKDRGSVLAADDIPEGQGAIEMARRESLAVGGKSN